VDASILGSNEYFARQGSGNIPYVQALYRDVLGREADSAGLEEHVAALARGATRTEVAFGFLTSVERGTQVAEEAYREVLGREGTEAELGMWAGVLARAPGGSAAVWASVAGSPEGTENLSAVSPVQNLHVIAANAGKLLLRWDAPAGNGATSYTVTMTTTTGTGSSSQTQVTTNTSLAYTGLLPSNSYAFSVTASNAAGTSVAAQTSFGQAPIRVGQSPWALTTGLDGSIWVANSTSDTVQQIVNNNGVWTVQATIGVGSKPTALTTGLDGSIWVTNQGSVKQENKVQHIMNVNGVWTVQETITLADMNPGGLTTGLDGSIWVSMQEKGNTRSNKLQQIVNNNGIWTTQPALKPGGGRPIGLTTGLDGSIWVANYNTNNVIQTVNNNGVWTVQPYIVVGKEPIAVTTGLDGSIWVANSKSNTVQQILNKSGVWTAQTAIDVGNSPWALTTGRNGSIWVANYESNTVQQIVNNNGVWTAQAAIGVGIVPTALTTGLDGSIWVVNVNQTQGPDLNKYPPGILQQVASPPDASVDLKAVFGPAPGEITLGWQPPVFDGGSPVISYTVTASQGTTSQTILTSATSVTFSGLTAGEGTTYFTVMATNFAGTSPMAELLLGSNGAPLPTTNSGVGIVTDGTPFAGGGFDGNGYAYSWEALGGTPTLGWNGVTFDLGSPNQPDFTWAAGQKIDVAQGDFNTLNLAGAAVNGSQTNQPITLNFVDGSSVVWTQSFSDWGGPQNYGHESIISTQSYRDTASGGAQQFTNHIYGYSYTIPAGKALASITLPNNPNVRLLDIQMSNSNPVNLSNAYTSWGIANGNTQVANQQGFDGGGYYYYSGNLQSTITWSGATFNFGPVPNSKNGQNNFVQGKGQTIDLPQGEFGWLYLAGAGANGNQTNQAMTLTFSDGTTETWTQSFSDWCGPQNYAGESIIQMQPSWVNQVGNVHSQTNYVYGYAYQIPAGKALVSVKLPNNQNVGILGISMVNDAPLPTTNSGVGIVTDGTPFAGGGFDSNGYAYSWEALGGTPTLGWNGVTFDLGSPNQPDFTSAVGQKIDVAQGDFNTLNLAAAAVNGSQTNQPITLNFTDGSSVVWTQSFSDWGGPQNYGHESIISTQSYRNTASGGAQQFTNHVYGYSYTIPAGKALASITLPNNSNVRLLDIQMSNSNPVNLSNAYTSWGIANGNTQVANHQGFDGGGYYYYSGNLQSTITWSGATFNFGPVPNSNNGQNNFVQGKGQTIDLPQGDFGWLYLAGAGANGNQTNQAMTLTFSDGTTETWTQSFSDWCGPQNYLGETIIQVQPNWVNQVGNVHSQTNYVYGYSYQIPAGKTLVSVKLPNNQNVGILGISMV
jgi:streptogramin lyase